MTYIEAELAKVHGEEEEMMLESDIESLYQDPVEITATCSAVMSDINFQVLQEAINETTPTMMSKISSKVSQQEMSQESDLTEPEEDCESLLKITSFSDATLVPESSDCENQNLFQNSREMPSDSLDPLCIDFTNIYEKILSYLDVKDILNLSEASVKDEII